MSFEFKKNKTDFTLDYGFSYSFDDLDSIDKDLKLFTSLHLKYKEQEVFKCNNYEFEFKKSNFPKVLTIDSNNYEFLFEVNDRPNKNYLLHIKVNVDSKKVKIDSLPMLIGLPHEIMNIRNIQFAGIYNYLESISSKENSNYYNYNPILFYKISKKGIVLDSLFTKEQNAKIFGKFYGFESSNKLINRTIFDKKSEEIILYKRCLEQ